MENVSYVSNLHHWMEVVPFTGMEKNEEGKAFDKRGVRI